jgi:hypothetical protein
LRATRREDLPFSRRPVPCPCSAVALSRNSRLGEKPGSIRRIGVRSLLSVEPYWENCVASGELSYGRSLYNNFRDYDPLTGRYVESDPAGLPGAIFNPQTGKWTRKHSVGLRGQFPNLYAYTDDAPVVRTDRRGLIEDTATQGCAHGSPSACAALAGDNAPEAPVGGSVTDPSTPIGRSGNPINVEPGTNEPGTVCGRNYSGHAFDQMQGRGIPPSAVENTIENGIPTPGNTPGTTVYYDTTNNLTAVVDTLSGRVITVHPGP